MSSAKYNKRTPTESAKRLVDWLNQTFKSIFFKQSGFHLTLKCLRANRTQTTNERISREKLIGLATFKQTHARFGWSSKCEHLRHVNGLLMSRRFHLFWLFHRSMRPPSYREGKIRKQSNRNRVIQLAARQTEDDTFSRSNDNSYIVFLNMVCWAWTPLSWIISPL